MQSFLWKVSLYRFFDAFLLIGAIFTLFFQEKGLDVFQIAVLISIWSASQLILEVPMGVVADKNPRRNVLVLASIVMALGFISWHIGGILFYGLGMVLWGLKNALTSGTFEAFLFDELKSIGEEQNYGKINGILEGAKQLGLMFSAILGGIVAEFNFDLVLLLSISSCIFSGLILLTIKPVQPFRSTEESEYLKVLKHAFLEIKSSPGIFYIILFISLTFGISGSADEFWPLIFNNLGINTTFVGALLALEFGMFALAGYTFPFWEKLKIKNWNLIIIITSGILFIIFGYGNSIVLLPLVFISSYLLKLSLVKLDTDLQHKISSNQRATVLSIKSLTFEIIYLISLVFFGYISTKLGVNSVIYIWGGLIILWVFILGRKLR